MSKYYEDDVESSLSSSPGGSYDDDDEDIGVPEVEEEKDPEDLISPPRATPKQSVKMQGSNDTGTTQSPSSPSSPKSPERSSRYLNDEKVMELFLSQWGSSIELIGKANANNEIIFDLHRKVVDVKLNFLVASSPQVVPEIISMFKGLRRLEIGYNGLAWSQCIALKELHGLEELLLSCNNAKGESLPEWMCEMRGIRALILDYCHMTWSDMEILQRLPNLQTLSLIDNNFRRDMMPDWFGRNMKSLKTLILSNNQLTWQQLQALRANRSIEWLILNKNLLSHGEGVPSWLLEMIHLRRIDLQGNNLKWSDCEIFQCMTNLIRLNLRENELNGEIPLWITELIGLQELDLSRNRLHGIIPPSIVKLINLKKLNLSNNWLKGTMPILPNCEEINIRDNAGLLVAKTKTNEVSGGMDIVFILVHILLGYIDLIGNFIVIGVFFHQSMLILLGVTVAFQVFNVLMQFIVTDDRFCDKVSVILQCKMLLEGYETVRIEKQTEELVRMKNIDTFCRSIPLMIVHLFALCWYINSLSPGSIGCIFFSLFASLFSSSMTLGSLGPKQGSILFSYQFSMHFLYYVMEIVTKVVYIACIFVTISVYGFLYVFIEYIIRYCALYCIRRYDYIQSKIRRNKTKRLSTSNGTTGGRGTSMGSTGSGSGYVFMNDMENGGENSGQIGNGGHSNHEVIHDRHLSGGLTSGLGGLGVGLRGVLGINNGNNSGHNSRPNSGPFGGQNSGNGGTPEDGLEEDGDNVDQLWAITMMWYFSDHVLGENKVHVGSLITCVAIVIMLILWNLLLVDKIEELDDYGIKVGIIILLCLTTTCKLLLLRIPVKSKPKSKHSLTIRDRGTSSGSQTHSHSDISVPVELNAITIGRFNASHDDDDDDGSVEFPSDQPGIAELSQSPVNVPDDMNRHHRHHIAPNASATHHHHPMLPLPYQDLLNEDTNEMYPDSSMDYMHVA